MAGIKKDFVIVLEEEIATIPALEARKIAGNRIAELEAVFTAFKQPRKGTQPPVSCGWGGVALKFIIKSTLY